MKALQTSRRSPGRSALRTLFWWNGVRTLMRWTGSAFYRLQVHGAEQVPERGPIIFVSNHQSHLDPPLAGILVGDRPFLGVARSTLFRPWILAWAMRSIGAISIERGKGDSAAMKAAVAALAAGECILIFPEGTRTRDGTIGTFQRGVTVLFKRSRAAVVPVAIEGAYDVWPTGRPLQRRGRIGVMAGPAIDSAELMRDGADAAVERLRREIETMRLDLRTRLRRTSGGRYPATGPADVPYWER